MSITAAVEEVTTTRLIAGNFEMDSKMLLVPLIAGSKYFSFTLITPLISGTGEAT